MIRIFLTGDNHIGLKYAGYEQGQRLVRHRIDALRRMVQAANEMHCDIFAVAGDLFHSRFGVGKQMVSEVADILAGFEEQVLIIPGNHDHYSTQHDGGNNKDVWSHFEAAISARENILLMTEYRPYELHIRDEQVIIYPGSCRTKHSQPGENNIGWICEQDIRPDRTYRIGMAHGAVEGQTIDTEGAYFLMTRKELESVPVDLWLIGHTHVPFPDLNSDAYREDGRIFNAGTHVQTDVTCNTSGSCFVIEVESGDGLKTVRAKRYVSGSVRFYRKNISIRSGEPLSDVLKRELRDLEDESVVDLVLSGSVTEEDHQAKSQIIDAALSRFLDRRSVDDSALCPLITAERVKREYSETSFAAQLLLKLLDEPREAQLAYDLLKECE